MPFTLFTVYSSEFIIHKEALKWNYPDVWPPHCCPLGGPWEPGALVSQWKMKSGRLSSCLDGDGCVCLATSASSKINRKKVYDIFSVWFGREASDHSQRAARGWKRGFWMAGVWKTVTPVIEVEGHLHSHPGWTPN